MSLPYPPWWIAQAEKRRAELSAGVDRLRRVLPQLAGVRGALIFGSYARNEVGPESDLDLIVVQETTLPLLERGADLRGPLFAALQSTYDLLVYTPEEYERYARQIPFVAQACREGIWLGIGPD